MEQIISKEKALELMKLTGEVRGLALKSHREFVLKEKGEEGLEKLEKYLSEIGCPLKNKEISPMKFYPIGIEIIDLLAIKQLFGFNKDKFIEIGSFSAKMSLILRLFMKYFVSMKLVANQSPIMWRKYYSIGQLTVTEYNEEDNYIVLRVENLNLHPLHCLHLMGYFSSVVKMVVKNPVTCEETSCVYNGDPYHEFLLKW